MNSTQMPPDEGGSGETDETIAGLPNHDSNSQAMLGDDQPTQKLPIKPVASQDSIATHSFHHSTLPGTDNFASQDALRPGFILGHYELTEIVGYGGFGTVWKAHDLRLRLVRVGPNQ